MKYLFAFFIALATVSAMATPPKSPSSLPTQEGASTHVIGPKEQVMVIAAQNWVGSVLKTDTKVSEVRCTGFMNWESTDKDGKKVTRCGWEIKFRVGDEERAILLSQQ
jgi:hypothetical protein